MSRYYEDKSMRDEIDRLTEENKKLKSLVAKMNADKKRLSRKRMIFNVIGFLMIVTGIAFLAVFAIGEIKNYNNAKAVKKLQQQRQEVSGTDVSDNAILPEYREMYKTNSDLVGWIVIDGTDVNYPVVQSKVYQEYYLDHDFDGEKSEAGAIFADARNDVFAPDDNIILYGHNMKNGSMFGTLQYYLQKEYYDKHDTVIFDTLYKRSVYKIVSVGLSKASDDEGQFRYYDFLNASDKKQFKNYIQNIKKLEAYDTGVSVEYGDRLITLSTCNSVEENGRLFIVAKEVKNEKI